MTDQLPTRDDFAGCLHTRFRVMDAPQQAVLDLELAQVSELRGNRSAQTFSIVFHGPAGRFMPQRIYRLSHDRLGELELFLVPVGKEGESILYEAVFNQLIPAPQQENRSGAGERRVTGWLNLILVRSEWLVSILPRRAGPSATARCSRFRRMKPCSHLIGTTYGGDGQNTFALPDLRSRVPMHMGGGHVIGEMGGQETVTLTAQQMPGHTHAAGADNNAGGLVSPAGGVWAASNNYIQFDPPAGANVTHESGGDCIRWRQPAAR